MSTLLHNACSCPKQSTCYSIAIIAMVEDHHGGEHQVSGSSSARPDAQINNASMPVGAPSAGPPLSGLQPAQLSNNQAFSTGVGSLNQTSDNSTSNQPHREPLTTIFPASKKAVKTPLISQEGFHWDQVSHPVPNPAQV